MTEKQPWEMPFMILNSPTLKGEIFFLPPLKKDSLYPGLDFFRELHLFKNGRSAVFHAIRLLLTIRKKQILMPSYCCGTEIEPVLRAGGEIVFYKVDRKMMVDIEDIEKHVNNNIGIVYVTHYNGFPQPIVEIKDLCRRHGLYLIEDCSHILKESDLGRYGDLSIFSMRKAAPIPDGGALGINSPDLHLDSSEFAIIRLRRTLRRTIYLLKRNLISRGLYPSFLWKKAIHPTINKKTRVNEEKVYNPLKVMDDSEQGFLSFDQKMSRVSEFLLRRIDFDKIISTRRDNFQYILQHIRDFDSVEPIFTYLPESVCPLYFMVSTDDPENTSRILLSRGIETIKFWNFFHPYVPWGSFPDAVYLKTHVLAIPVHEDLKDHQREFLVSSLRYSVNNYNLRGT